MITLYTCSGNESCRFAKAWLETHEYPFVIKNSSKCPLTLEELKQMLRFSENGTEDILSHRSKVYIQNKNRIDAMKLEELLHLIHQYPQLLRHPILMDEKRMQIGYNSERAN